MRRSLARLRWNTNALKSERDFLRLLKTLKSARRIIIGPWTGELGSEILYWIPFVRTVLRDVSLNVELVVLGRGGSAVWYPGSHTDLDLFEVFQEAYWSGKVFPRLQSEGLAMKQTRKSEVDFFMREQCGVGFWLHPEMLFSVIRPFLVGKRDADWVGRFLDFGKSKSELPSGASAGDKAEWTRVLDALPAKFIAVRGYARPSVTRDQVGRAFGSILKSHFDDDLPVVDLSIGFSVDDHFEVPCASASRQPLDGVSAHMNLALQQAVIERSQALVCSYGGTAYLGLMAGVSTYAVVGDPSMYVWRHLDIANHLSSATGSSIELVSAV